MMMKDNSSILESLQGKKVFVTVILVVLIILMYELTFTSIFQLQPSSGCLQSISAPINAVSSNLSLSSSTSNTLSIAKPVKDIDNVTDIPLPADFSFTYAEPELKYTIIVPSFNREKSLRQFLNYYTSRMGNTCPFLHKIIILWPPFQQPKPPQDLIPNDMKDRISLIIPKDNSLSYRFFPYSDIETDAIFAIDDDLRIDCQHLDLAFKTWKAFPDRIVGYLPRAHGIDKNTGKYAYQFGPSEKGYNIILTSSAIYHRNYNKYFWSNSSVMTEIRNHIAAKRNCEDIALNYLASHLTKKPPVMVTGEVNVVTMPGLSYSNQHFTKRSECLNIFKDWFGYMPIENVYSDFTVAERISSNEIRIPLK